mgnify:FL=1
MKSIIKSVAPMLMMLLAFSLNAETKNQITCTGSTTVLPIAQATAEVFMNNHAEINISVRGGGSGVGIASLQNKTTDICNSSRPLKSKEISTAKAKGINPIPYAIANDAITIVVHNSNLLNNLSIKQIKDIYTGNIINWKELGGANVPIVVISRDVASGTYEVFNDKVLAGAKVIGSAQLLASNNAVISAVSNTPGAIGYVGLGYLNDNAKLLSVNKVTPSELTVKNNSYPLSRKLYMYTNGKAKGIVANYIGFIQSDRGQKIVVERGFINIK